MQLKGSPRNTRAFSQANTGPGHRFSYLPVLLMSGLSLGTVQCNTPTARTEQNQNTFRDAALARSSWLSQAAPDSGASAKVSPVRGRGTDS